MQIHKYRNPDAGIQMQRCRDARYTEPRSRDPEIQRSTDPEIHRSRDPEIHRSRDLDTEMVDAEMQRCRSTEAEIQKPGPVREEGRFCPTK
jgi:hypothetical protein